jgi:hypothetical protein
MHARRVSLIALLVLTAVHCTTSSAILTDGGVPNSFGSPYTEEPGQEGPSGLDPDGGNSEITDKQPDSGVTPVAPPTVRFIAFGDTGKGDGEQRKVADAVQKKCEQSGCDFGLLPGDNIYDNGPTSAEDDQFQTKFEQPYANLNFPFYVVLGNHDYGGSGLGSDFYKGQYEVDYTSRSSKWKMPAKYYRLLEKHVEFFATDTNMQMYGQDDDQRRDVLSWLESSTATWKIAIGHHPFKSNGPHGNAGNYEGITWAPILSGNSVEKFFIDVVCGRADLYLSGHDHSRQWLSETCNGTELVVSGAGATGTELPGSNLTRFQSVGTGFLYVKIEGEKLTAEFINSEGVVEFTRNLQKN